MVDSNGSDQRAKAAAAEAATSGGSTRTRPEPRAWFARAARESIEPSDVVVEDITHEVTDEQWSSGSVAPAKLQAPRTLVEEGTEFRGSFMSSCPIEVKGRVEGDVAAPSLAVTETGAVRGKVKVGELRSRGEIAGELDADVACLSGIVKDNTVLRTKSLEMKLTPAGCRTQVIFGTCASDVASPSSPTVTRG